MGSASSAARAAAAASTSASSADDVPVLVGTFGKAFGTFGAFVAGDADLIEFLIQKSRTYIYTTALPPAVAAATRAALAREPARIVAARKSAGAGADDSGAACAKLGSAESRNGAGTAIVPVILGDAQRALAASRALEEQGFLVTAIRPPTVPAGTARLRVTLVGGARGSAGGRADRGARRRRWPHERCPIRARFSRSIAAPWRRPSTAPAPATTPPRRCRSACATSCWRGSPNSRWRRSASSISAPAPAMRSRALKRRYPASLVVAADIAPGMLARAKAQSRWLRRFERVRADAYSLPFRDGAFDLVFSNLMLQWCDDLDAVFAEIARVLKPGGLLLFSTFGPGTLAELREAWAASGDAGNHVNHFFDPHALGSALMHARARRTGARRGSHRRRLPGRAHADARAQGHRRTQRDAGPRARTHRTQAARRDDAGLRNAAPRRKIARDLRSDPRHLPGAPSVASRNMTAFPREAFISAERHQRFGGQLMSGFFITGTDTGVGKTLVTVALTRALVARGLRIAVMKPVAAGTMKHREGRATTTRSSC